MTFRRYSAIALLVFKAVIVIVVTTATPQLARGFDDAIEQSDRLDQIFESLMLTAISDVGKYRSDKIGPVYEITAKNNKLILRRLNINLMC